MVYRMLAVALALVVTSPALAQEQGKRHKQDGGRREKLLKKFDKDGDGKLNREERAAARAALQEHRKAHRAEILKKFDKDGNGKLDRRERAAARKAIRKHHGRRGARKSGRKSL